MKLIERVLDPRKILEKNSCFLFGPRQTGKTSLIASQFPGALRIDLLDEDEYLRLQSRPTQLRERIPERGGLVVIDEIQRVPALLNEVHRLIESHRNVKFLLTGSSARKLRGKGVNLLGGRARSRRIHPFVRSELKEKFDLKRALLHGCLPPFYLSDEPREGIKAYVGDYLREEIAAEALTRNIPAFGRFLETAALSSGQLLNYQNVANDAQVKRSTVQNYYEILRDTLIGSDLEPFRKTRTRKAIATAKFYFFDLGVVNYLRGVREMPERTTGFGEAFEAHMHHELRTWVDTQGDGELRFWRSASGYEVDFILNGSIAIECKASRSIAASDLRGLKALAEEQPRLRRMLVCFESAPRKVDGIEVLPWMMFLDRLWAGSLS